MKDNTEYIGRIVSYTDENEQFCCGECLDANEKYLTIRVLHGTGETIVMMDDVYGCMD